MLKLFDGPNFSGRTTALRDAVLAAKENSQQSVAYIGPEVFTSFSGLAATLEGELELLDEGVGKEIVTTLKIQHLLERNLSTLSGGEEVLCAIASGLACSPAIIALDCVLEQLDFHRRTQVLDVLGRCFVQDVSLADNRSQEWANGNTLREVLPIREENNAKFRPIDGQIRELKSADRASEILISGLCHRYGKGPWVLDDLNLQLKPGRIVHLAGENGAGKSTLAKILVGALEPNAGKIQHNGTESTWSKPGRLASYHFQNPDMQLFRTTVQEELLAGAKVHGRSADVVTDLVDSAAVIFGLSGILSAHPLDLPFSMRKRVALAATFACGTPWIILDEPTLGQDDQSVEQIASIVKRMAEGGTGIILITHSRSFVDKLPHQRIMLANGKAENGN